MINRSTTRLPPMSVPGFLGDGTVAPDHPTQFEPASTPRASDPLEGHTGGRVREGSFS
jgi:hypothetical protein